MFIRRLKRSVKVGYVPHPTNVYFEDGKKSSKCQKSQLSQNIICFCFKAGAKAKSGLGSPSSPQSGPHMDEESELGSIISQQHKQRRL